MFSTNFRSTVGKWLTTLTHSPLADSVAEFWNSGFVRFLKMVATWSGSLYLGFWFSKPIERADQFSVKFVLPPLVLSAVACFFMGMVSLYDFSDSGARAGKRWLIACASIILFLIGASNPI